ncbi:DNA topoisomerase III [Pseudoalteromonas sp. APC 3224]|uniref:DNA topoisomerase III n=1 Tax=Pseudoalteromonas sp. APC 3224 TaxID=3035203 RepID=UPI0025B3587F|nr:DNA topoisomerase III [Pseudoalteromonas sp. APC 3224]MDN3485293.1 DNA topoisomerase III [Pseudoalteromonas sp. APC 3224]
MRLFIAEKPSLARALIAVLPKPHKKNDGYTETGNGDIVTWCIGHLLEQAEPQFYNPEFKKWSVDHLPIIPDEWKLVAKSKTKKQLSVVKKLIKQADQLVNVGDPDREGQILVDEVINFCGVSKAKNAKTLRCLISDLNPSAVKKSVNSLQKNSDFIPLATSALARARADWLYGINMTRLCTLQGQKSGYQGVLSIGRVQTPVLGLVVHRDMEIENFVSKPFYEVLATLKTNDDECYEAKWKPSKACEPYMDEGNHVVSKKLVETVVEKITNKEGVVADVKETIKKQAPPLPYSLSALQIDASKRFGMSAQNVLDTCQELYERFQLITYPRSDSRHLPKEHLKEVNQVTNAIKSNHNALGEAVDNANLNLKSRAWDDSKVTAHHAIIPTSKTLNMSNLSSFQTNIYELIARQYLIQFYSDFEYQEKQIDTKISGGLFVTKQKEVISQGWKVLFPAKLANNKNSDNDFSAKKLPNVKINELVQCINAQLIEKQTSPPKYFNDASLLSAMTGIARYVQDSSIKKIMRETDGLGTEATRAGIIELLFKRQFLKRNGKEIRATDVGKELITGLPEKMVVPDMTAHWESQLESINQREMTYNNFMQPLTIQLNRLVQNVQSIDFQALKGKGKSSFKPKTRRKSAQSRRPIKNNLNEG